MKTSTPESAQPDATPPEKTSPIVGKYVIEAGLQTVRYMPPFLVLLLPLLALMPDQGHEVIEAAITGKQWTYLTVVLTPMALTALLHSVQMLRRAGHMRQSPAAPVSIDSSIQLLASLLITVAGLITLAAPLYAFRLADSECVEDLPGFNGGDDCHPGQSLLFLATYYLLLILIPFLIHARSKSSANVNGGFMHNVRRHWPAFAQLLLVLVLGGAMVGNTVVDKDYGLIIAGCLVSLFLVRLPRIPGPAVASKNYLQNLNACVGDAWLTIALAVITLIVFATFPLPVGQLLGSLFVLYAGVLCWVVVVSFVWSCFLMLRNRLPVVGLCALGVIGLAITGTLYGSSDTVTGAKTPADYASHEAHATGSDPASATTSIEEDFKTWSTYGGNGVAPRMVIIVLAEGGGIRSAQWTNDMLFWLNVADSGILRNTYAIVGISGGALGSTAFLAHLAALYDYQLGHTNRSQILGEPTAVALHDAQSALTQDLMAPWLARSISIGAIQALLPGDVTPGSLIPILWRAVLTCMDNRLPPVDHMSRAKAVVECQT